MNNKDLSTIVAKDIQEDNHSVSVSPETLKAFLTENNLWRPLNQWYKSKNYNGFCVFFTGNKEGFGFGAFNVGWYDQQSGWRSIQDEDWYPMTEDEIKEMLIEEAKSKGYKSGNYKCLYVPNLTVRIVQNKFYIDSKGNVWMGDTKTGNNMVFDGKTGIWAEIIEIPEYTMEELYKKVGETFTIKNS